MGCSTKHCGNVRSGKKRRLEHGKGALNFKKLSPLQYEDSMDTFGLAFVNISKIKKPFVISSVFLLGHRKRLPHEAEPQLWSTDSEGLSATYRKHIYLWFIRPHNITLRLYNMTELFV